eukprot:1156243-Pelagomonas_calceolata.AAC.7
MLQGSMFLCHGLQCSCVAGRSVPVNGCQGLSVPVKGSVSLSRAQCSCLGLSRAHMLQGSVFLCQWLQCSCVAGCNVPVKGRSGKRSSMLLGPSVPFALQGVKGALSYFAGT